MDKNLFLFSHLSRTFIPLYMYIYVRPPFPWIILYQLTGWSSQCVWWWGKLLGWPCRRRWQSKQKATRLPSSVGLPGLCTEPLLLWGRRKSKSFHLAEECSCIAQDNETPRLTASSSSLKPGASVHRAGFGAALSTQQKALKDAHTVSCHSCI